MEVKREKEGKERANELLHTQPVAFATEGNLATKSS